MAAKLFRQEALAHQAQRHWGKCTGLAPAGLSVLVWLLAAMTLTGAGFLVTGSYPRKSVVPGILVADLGAIQVRAPVGGMVEQLAAGTGQEVGTGEFLLSLRPGILKVNDQPVTRQLLAENRQQELLLTARLQASSAEYALRREQLGSEIRRLQERQRELAVLLAGEQGVMDLMSSQHQRLRVLAARNLAPDSDLDKTRMEILKQEAVMQQARLQLADTREDISARQRELKLLAFEQDRGKDELVRNLSELRKQNLRLQAEEAVSLSAPVAGTVAVVLVEQGDAVAANQPLLKLLPKGAVLDAELRIPSRAMGFLREGLVVNLRLDTFPYQKYGMLPARIREVARVPVMPTDMGGAGSAEPYYKVTAKLDEQVIHAFGATYPLRPGMQFQADVVLESRTLLAWLLEPLRILSGPG